MKLLVFLIFISTFSYAQFSYGIKGGVNYGFVGDFKVSSATNTYNAKRDGFVGYHVGIFTKVNLPVVYLRPELYFTRMESKYDSSNFYMNKMDLPVLVGFKLFPFVSIFAGPSGQYIIGAKLGNYAVGNIENKFAINGQLGIMVNFWKIGVDVRYETGLYANNATVNHSNINLRPNQLLFGISFRL